MNTTPRPSNRNVVIGAVVSLVTVLVAVGLVFLVGGDDLELPDELGGRPAADSVEFVERADADRREELRERARAGFDYNSEQVSEALGGADAATRSYVSLDADVFRVTVVAVAADAGPLLPERPFDDPESLGYALPQVERIEQDDAECLLRRSRVFAADAEVDPEEAAPDSITCQRSTGALTVRVYAGPDPDLDLDQTIDLLEEIWDEVD